MRSPFAVLLLSLLPSLAGLALPARAETPLTAQEFETYATGKTLTYADGGVEFGTEQYLSDRRVRWAFTNDVCKIGHWYSDGPLICFVYEDQANPQCWKFWRDGPGLKAQFEGDAAGRELTVVRETTTPMACSGPDVGV